MGDCYLNRRCGCVQEKGADRLATRSRNGEQEISQELNLKTKMRTGRIRKGKRPYFPDSSFGMILYLVDPCTDSYEPI